MIDIESMVIDKVNSAVKAQYPEAVVYSTYVGNPAKFPCVMVYEVVNAERADLRTADGVERYADISFTVQVLTNGDSKKQNAKKIYAIVDSVMRSLVLDNTLGIHNGFNRTGKNYVFTTNESSIFVASGTYSALVGESPSGALSFYNT